MLNKVKLPVVTAHYPLWDVTELTEEVLLRQFIDHKIFKFRILTYKRTKLVKLVTPRRYNANYPLRPASEAGARVRDASI